MRQEFNLKATVRSRAEASRYLMQPGDAVVVDRGGPRWLIILCPCGCGDEIPVNVDPRAGPAWRLYRRGERGLSLFPSVWRDTDCKSHFIIRRNQILLFKHRPADFRPVMAPSEVDALSLLAQERLPISGSKSFVEVAEDLGAVPWDVLDALRHLVRKGLAIEGQGEQQGCFKRSLNFDSGMADT